MTIRPLHIRLRGISRMVLRTMITVGALVLFSVPCSGQRAESDDPVESLKVENLWPHDPDFVLPSPILKFDGAYRTLWLDALQHPEADLQQEIVTTFERVHRSGNLDVSVDAAVFRKLLTDDSHPILNIAVASLLCTIDDRESADRLFEILNPKRIEMSQVVEPALARWDYQPIRDVWRARLNDPDVRRAHLLLALESLGVVRDETAVDRLLEIATDLREYAALRIAAARSVGQIRSDGLLPIAEKYSAKLSARGIIDRLCAVAFLARHESGPSNQLLQRMSLDPEPTVAAGAWIRLLQIDSALAVTQADAGMKNADPIVRGLAVQSLVEQPTLARIDALGVMMDDRHPNVRQAARIGLHRLALLNEEFDHQVRIAGMKAVQESESGYRGQEQALLLLTALDHKNVAGIAVELLEHEHPWVLITAAWALRRLQIPETLPAMLDRAKRVSDVFVGDEPNQQTTMGIRESMDQVAHLFDAFGQMDYREADGLLRSYIPKNLNLGDNSRPAAIAAIGKLHRGNPDPELVEQLVTRMHDQSGTPPDIYPVFTTSAIALGRMQAKSRIKDLERYFTGEPPQSPFKYACAWSIRELTGRQFPAAVAPFTFKTGFNLEPGTKRIKEARLEGESPQTLPRLKPPSLP